MLQNISENKYFSTAITIGLGLYAALLGPNLPKFIKDLFANTLFRILVLFLVVVRGNKDPQMAIMIAIAFVLTLDYISANEIKEKFGQTCPQDFIYNDQYRECVWDCKKISKDGKATYEPQIRQCINKKGPKCSAGYGLNVITNLCEKCEPGTIRDQGFNVCVQDV